MTVPSEIISKASEIAVEEDAVQVVGLIDGKWSIAHIEDDGRISEMKGNTYRVDGIGLIVD
jgi:hypothetical protein